MKTKQIIIMIIFVVTNLLLVMVSCKKSPSLRSEIIESGSMDETKYKEEVSNQIKVVDRKDVVVSFDNGIIYSGKVKVN